jgi:hypothetical protein
MFGRNFALSAGIQQLLYCSKPSIKLRIEFFENKFTPLWQLIFIKYQIKMYSDRKLCFRFIFKIKTKRSILLGNVLKYSALSGRPLQIKRQQLLSDLLKLMASKKIIIGNFVNFKPKKCSKSEIIV